MTDIREQLAQIIAFAGREPNDASKDAGEFWAHTGLCSRQRHQAQAQAIIDALPSLVKPLEWEHVDYGRLMGWRAKTEFGIYSVQSDHVYFEGCAIDHSGGTDKLKSAAQADYTRRILAALGVEQ